jgi:hypothetical protein
MRWSPAPGVQFDVINLHADAGTEAGDETARTANIQQVLTSTNSSDIQLDNRIQVADYVTANSVGNPVLIFGDTNSRYTRTADNIPTIVKQNGLTDAWVQLVRKGSPPAAGSGDLVCPDNAVPQNTSCEVVDKVL